MILRSDVLTRLLACLAITMIVGLSPAAAQQKSFLLFFDYGKTEIVSSGKEIVESIVNTVKANGKVGKIILIGHTDTAEEGSLSLVRAMEVAKALVATGGFPSDAEISIKGVGASQPLVKTGPNVHEPQNRFVTILLDASASAVGGTVPRPQAATSSSPSDGRDSVVDRIPGEYACNGSNPNGSTYRCTVTISRSGGLYSFHWLIADGTRYRGTGRLRGRTLTVNWGQSAPVIYRVGDDGVLRGTWARGEGREVLSPNR